MSGTRITSHQVGLYMRSKRTGKSRQVSAASAGFSERSTYRLETQSGEPATTKRQWKTRPDPFDVVWNDILLPLLEATPKLEARTLLEHLQERFEGQYPDRLLRTLQRRVRLWRAEKGPEKEIIFRQDHPPGLQGISDFTNAGQLCVLIRGEPLDHLLYHFRLSYSGREYVQVTLGGESFTALAEGLQNALWSIGGAPKTHRTDSLSAAYKNCSDKSKEKFTKSYLELCQHYRMEPTRNNKGISHENGSIESPNGHLKRRLEQALLLRGSRNFDSLDAYRAFVREVLWKINKRMEKAFLEEITFLKPLPERRACDYDEEYVRVTSSSTISMRQITYSVPSRLIGMLLKVHLHDDRLECYLGATLVVTLKRLRRHKKRVHCVDYRHVVGSLIRKPQAFRNYIYREELFPTPAFRQAWECLDRRLDPHQSCREYVKILYEAARPDAEERVNSYLEGCFALEQLPSSTEVRALFGTHVTEPPILKMITPELSDYDVLLERQGGVA